MIEHDWNVCGEQTSRMKAPCALPKAHLTHPAWRDSRSHRSKGAVNDDTPRLTEFARIVNAALDRGLQLSYLEIGELMDHRNLRSVAQYGLGSRYTKLRQKIYAERGVKPKMAMRSAEASAKIVADMRAVL